MDSIYIEPQMALNRQKEYRDLVFSCYEKARNYCHPDIPDILDKNPDEFIKSVLNLFNRLCGLWWFTCTISKYELLQDSPTDLLSIFMFDIKNFNLTPSDSYKCLSKILPSFAEYVLRSVYKNANVRELDHLLKAIHSRNKNEFTAYIDISSNEWKSLSDLCRKFWLADGILDFLEKPIDCSREGHSLINQIHKNQHSLYNRGMLWYFNVLLALNECRPTDVFRLKLIKASLHSAYSLIVYFYVILSKQHKENVANDLLKLLRSKELIEWYEADYDIICQKPGIIFERRPFVEFKCGQEIVPKKVFFEGNRQEDNQQAIEKCLFVDIKNKRMPISKKELDKATVFQPQARFFEGFDEKAFEGSPYTIQDYEDKLRAASQKSGVHFVEELIQALKFKYIKAKHLSARAFFDMLKSHFNISYGYTNFMEALKKNGFDWDEYRKKEE